MTDSELIEKSLEIALRSHKGQLDLDGKPVIMHPLYVGMSGSTTYEKVTGFLHDVVEDSEITFDDLLKEGIPEEVVDALRLLTHNKDVPYDEYVRNIGMSGNHLAIRTKFVDLNNNLNRGKAGNHFKQVEKHTKGLALLKSLMTNRQ